MKRPTKPKLPPEKVSQRYAFYLDGKSHPPASDQKPTTLQDMIDWAAQGGFSPRDVVFKTSYHLDCYDFDIDTDLIDVEVSARLETSLEEQNPQYPAQLEQYEADMVQYKAKRAEYDAYRKAKKEEETRLKISALKAQQEKLERELK